MPITNKEAWQNWQDKNKDPYGGACVKVAGRVMELLDEVEEFDPHAIICQANDDTIGGITGFMAGCVAEMVTVCHSRGEEFRKAWNKYHGVEEDKGGVVNPAIVTINI